MKYTVNASGLLKRLGPDILHASGTLRNQLIVGLLSQAPEDPRGVRWISPCDLRDLCLSVLIVHILFVILFLVHRPLLRIAED